MTPGFHTPALRAGDPALLAGVATPPALTRKAEGHPDPAAPHKKAKAEHSDDPDPASARVPSEEEDEDDDDDADEAAATAEEAKANAEKEKADAEKAKAEAKAKAAAKAAAEKNKKKAKDFAAKIKSFVDLKREMDLVSGSANRMLTASAIDTTWSWASHDGFCQPIRDAQKAVTNLSMKSDLWKFWTMTSPKEWPKQARTRFKDKQIEQAHKTELAAMQAAVSELGTQVSFLEAVAIQRGALKQ